VNAPALSHELDGQDFEPVCDLGRGGMGTVRLVRLRGPEEFGRLFVQKRLRDDHRDQDSAQRFAYEGRLASSIRHANVVQTHHVGQDDQGLFLLLEYVEGASLEQLLAAHARSGQALPRPVVLRLALDALAGLTAVHEARDLLGRELGVLHRDVTLQNLMIGVDGLTRLADFGIAKGTHSPVVTDQAYVLGKLRFLAPEYVRRDPVTQSIDVYSLGVSLWHAFTGKVLWRQANEAELVEHVLLDSIPAVSTFVDVPAELDAIMLRACARDPGKRFATAREMAAAIEASGLPIATRAEVGELVQRAFERELGDRRRQIAEVTGRARRYEPKVFSQHVRLPAVSGAPSSAALRVRHRRQVAGFAAAAVLLVACVAFAALEVRAGATSPSAAPARAPAPTTPAISPGRPSVAAPAAPAPTAVTEAPPAVSASEPAVAPATSPRRAARPVLTAAPLAPARAAGSPAELVKKNPYSD
jgi:eukaryotic-like serine/threonine-protein kinase